MYQIQADISDHLYNVNFSYKHILFMLQYIIIYEQIAAGRKYLNKFHSFLLLLIKNGINDNI